MSSSDHGADFCGLQLWSCVKPVGTRNPPLYAKGEHLTVYMGEDMGRSDTTESLEAQERLAAVKRADHVMEIAGRYVDGRNGIT